MVFRREGVPMGLEMMSEFERFVTDADAVARRLRRWKNERVSGYAAKNRISGFLFGGAAACAFSVLDRLKMEFYTLHIS